MMNIVVVVTGTVNDCRECGKCSGLGLRCVSVHLAVCHAVVGVKDLALQLAASLQSLPGSHTYVSMFALNYQLVLYCSADGTLLISA